MATSEWLQLLSSLLQLVAWLLVLAAFVYTLVSGLFWHVRVRTGVSTFGHMCLAYKWIETGSKTTIDTELAKLAEFVAKRADHKHYLMIIRYDNDSHVSTGERMRCAIGVVLALGDPTSGDPGDIDEELENALLLRKDFKMCLFTRIEHAVIAEFPNRTRLARRLIGTRVYPKLKQFIRSNKLCAYPFIELHGAWTTQFLVPLCEQEKFFLPENYAELEKLELRSSEDNTDGKESVRQYGKRLATKKRTPKGDAPDR